MSGETLLPVYIEKSKFSGVNQRNNQPKNVDAMGRIGFDDKTKELIIVASQGEEKRITMDSVEIKTYNVKFHKRTYINMPKFYYAPAANRLVFEVTDNKTGSITSYLANSSSSKYAELHAQITGKELDKSAFKETYFSPMLLLSIIIVGVGVIGIGLDYLILKTIGIITLAMLLPSIGAVIFILMNSTKQINKFSEDNGIIPI